jgi:hypothetical protein
MLQNPSDMIFVILAFAFCGALAHTWLSAGRRQEATVQTAIAGPTPWANIISGVAAYAGVFYVAGCVLVVTEHLIARIFG